MVACMRVLKKVEKEWCLNNSECKKKTRPVSEYVKFGIGNDMHCYIFYFYLKLDSFSFLHKQESRQKDFSGII